MAKGYATHEEKRKALTCSIHEEVIPPPLYPPVGEVRHYELEWTPARAKELYQTRENAKWANEKIDGHLKGTFGLNARLIAVEKLLYDLKKRVMDCEEKLLPFSDTEEFEDEGDAAE